MKECEISDSLENWPQVTPRSVLHHDVDRELSAYHERTHADDFALLDLDALKAACTKGEIRHGSMDITPDVIDPSIARRSAAEAVIDGVVLMFVDGMAVQDLDEVMEVSADSRVRYVRLHAQSGL